MTREIEDETCPDCGKMLFVGPGYGDDIMRPAYITNSGDLYCDRCGPGHDEADEDGDGENFEYEGGGELEVRVPGE